MPQALKDVLAILALVGSCIVACFLVPDLPWRHLGEPAYGGALSALFVLAAIFIARLFGPRGARAERIIFALFLIGMPQVYLGGWVRAGSFIGPWLWLELLGAAIFTTLGILGVFRSPYLLVIGIAGHGIFWDAWHYHRVNYIPDWYAIGCLVVDIGFALYALSRVPFWRAHGRSRL
jgi:hypothetical protein